MSRKNRRINPQVEAFGFTLDNYFEAYQRGEFPSDEELTEWSVK